VRKARKLGQLQPFIAVFLSECTGQQVHRLGQPNASLAASPAVAAALCASYAMPDIPGLELQASALDSLPPLLRPPVRYLLLGPARSGTFVHQVRQTPSWPRTPEAGPTSAVYSCIPTGMHGPTCTFRANLTPFSLKDPVGTATWNVEPRAAKSCSHMPFFFIRDVHVKGGLQEHDCTARGLAAARNVVTHGRKRWVQMSPAVPTNNRKSRPTGNQ
jgi:hypothetical protein